MTISLTNLLGTQANIGGTSYTSGSFTTVNSSLLVVGWMPADQTSSYTSGQYTISNSGTALTWTQQKFQNSIGNGFAGAVYIWTAPVTTGASTTVTLTVGSGTIGNFAISVDSVTGHNTSTPIGATGSNDNSGSGSLSNITFSLSGSPATTSAIYSITSTVINNTSTGVTVGSGWTSLYSFGDSSKAEGSEYITGTSSATVTWANVAAGDTPGGFGSAQAAIEIQAAAGAETITLDKWWMQPSYRPPKTEIVGY